MVIRAAGTVKDGMIIPDMGVTLPEGARVNFEAEVVDATAQATLGKSLLKFAGIIKEGLPSDFAQNHDHYIHGTPKGIDDR